MTRTSRLAATTSGTLYFVVSAFFWIGLVGTGVGWLVGIASFAASDHPLGVWVTVSPRALGHLPSGVSAARRLAVSIPIDHPTTTQSVIYLAAGVIASAVVLFGLWKLRQIARSVREGDPFIDANVGRLRVIGLLLLIGYPVFQYVTGGLNEWMLRSAPYVSTARVDVDPFSAGIAFAALCVLVIAEVFAHGMRLREDVEGTV